MVMQLHDVKSSTKNILISMAETVPTFIQKDQYPYINCETRRRGMSNLEKRVVGCI